MSVGPAGDPTLITDPFFFAAAIPAVLLLGISKSGFGAGFGSLAAPFGRCIHAGMFLTGVKLLRDGFHRETAVALNSGANSVDGTRAGA